MPLKKDTPQKSKDTPQKSKDTPQKSKDTPQKAKAAAATTPASTPKPATKATPKKAADSDTSKKPATPKVPKTALVWTQVKSAPGAPIPVAVTFEGDKEISKQFPKGNTYVHTLKLQAPAGFEIVETYMIKEGSNEGNQAIIIKPAKPFEFLKLPQDVRNRIYKLYFASKGVIDSPIIVEAKRKSDQSLYAKNYANGSKERVALLAVNKEINAEATRQFYSSTIRIDSSSALLEFIGLLSPMQKLYLRSLDIKNFVKTHSRTALAFLAESKNLRHLRFEVGVSNEADPEKAAKSFWIEAHKLLEAVAASMAKEKVIRGAEEARLKIEAEVAAKIKAATAEAKAKDKAEKAVAEKTKTQSDVDAEVKTEMEVDSETQPKAQQETEMEVDGPQTNDNGAIETPDSGAVETPDSGATKAQDKGHKANANAAEGSDEEEEEEEEEEDEEDDEEREAREDLARRQKAIDQTAVGILDFGKEAFKYKDAKKVERLWDDAKRMKFLEFLADKLANVNSTHSWACVCGSNESGHSCVEDVVKWDVAKWVKDNFGVWEVVADKVENESDEPLVQSGQAMLAAVRQCLQRSDF